MSTPLAFIHMPGGIEWIFIAGIGLLLFGKRLPEVGRGIARSIVEFKKGLRGIDDEIEDAVQRPNQAKLENQRASEPASDKALGGEQSGYKLDPYTGEPVAQKNTSGSA